jgi:hypothetical protein
MTLMTMIFGGHLDHYDYHLAGLDEASLGSFLHDAGFVSVRRVASFGLFEDSSVIRMLNVPISLNMIAERGD